MSSTVSCSSAAARVGGVIPSSARIAATATGWVMYGSPLLRFCPAWARAATSKARSSTDRSAFGWLARTVRSNGSSNGEVVGPRPDPNRAIRDSTRVVPARPSVGEVCRCRALAGTVASAAGSGRSAAASLPFTAGTLSSATPPPASCSAPARSLATRAPPAASPCQRSLRRMTPGQVRALPRRR